ncbi:hypothetical protein CBR_g30560 [Chara braunii]|uniref:Uncharacterized protein n=1 Tax=Chara braunii TaxID=69332 RepID=A0A388LD16_CHABU|nr:hypothetical protein CBR_g30560 [Chara braunii]|eukprot:GBG80194.1 hypothetical protein CBR_g30560 [Chara braunii]
MSSFLVLPSLTTYLAVVGKTLDQKTLDQIRRKPPAMGRDVGNARNPWRAVVVKAEVSGDGSLGPGRGGGILLTEAVASSAYSTHTHVAALGPNSFVTAFYDGSNSDSGTVVVGSIGQGIGVAASSANEGEQAAVIISGVSTTHKALNVGSCYFGMADGTLTVARTGHPVGLAISSSELLLNGCR